MKKPQKARTITARGAISPEAIAAAKGANGIARAAHFAAGGTVAGWRGRSVTMDNDTPRARSKKACRGRVYA